MNILGHYDTFVYLWGSQLVHRAGRRFYPAARGGHDTILMAPAAQETNRVKWDHPHFSLLLMHFQ